MDGVDEVGSISTTGARMPACLYQRQQRDGEAAYDEVHRAAVVLVPGDVRSVRLPGEAAVNRTDLGDLGAELDRTR